MIIIPDVHGRSFWKDAVKNDEKVIFLGDYVDPYSGENISSEEAIKILEEIIDYKKSNPDNTILLLGNHDFMYMDSRHRKISCRHDYKNEDKIEKLFKDNSDLFQMSYSMGISGTTYIFSHAGILRDWIDNHTNIFGENTTIPEAAKISNDLYRNWDSKFIRSLLDITVFRGGYDNCASMVWADVRDHFIDKNFEEGVYQIFGHTQVKKSFIRDHYADLDIRKAFMLNEKTGELKEL